MKLRSITNLPHIMLKYKILCFKFYVSTMYHDFRDT